MPLATSGISAVLAGSPAHGLAEPALLDLAAVLDGLVGGTFELLVEDRYRAEVEDLRQQYPHLPLRAVEGDLAARIDAGVYDLVLLWSPRGELEPQSLNHFLEAIEHGADVVLGYRPPSPGRLAWTAFVWLAFATTARDLECPFKLFRREVWTRAGVPAWPVDRWFNARLVVRARRLGFRVLELPVRELGAGRAGVGTALDSHTVATI
jgi:hypothetical protein